MTNLFRYSSEITGMGFAAVVDFGSTRLNDTGNESVGVCWWESWCYCVAPVGINQGVGCRLWALSNKRQRCSSTAH